MLVRRVILHMSALLAASNTRDQEGIGDGKEHIQKINLSHDLSTSHELTERRTPPLTPDALGDTAGPTYQFEQLRASFITATAALNS